MWEEIVGCFKATERASPYFHLGFHDSLISQFIYFFLFFFVSRLSAVVVLFVLIVLIVPWPRFTGPSFISLK
jgi:hypothetical protein